MSRSELVICEEYNEIYPEESEFWAWVESMEQDYIKRINLEAEIAAEFDCDSVS